MQAEVQEEEAKEEWKTHICQRQHTQETLKQQKRSYHLESVVNELKDKHDTLSCGAPSCNKEVDLSVTTSTVPSRSHIRRQDGDTYEVRDNAGDKVEHNGNGQHFYNLEQAEVQEESGEEWKTQVMLQQQKSKRDAMDELEIKHVALNCDAPNCKRYDFPVITPTPTISSNSHARHHDGNLYEAHEDVLNSWYFAFLPTFSSWICHNVRIKHFILDSFVSTIFIIVCVEHYYRDNSDSVDLFQSTTTSFGSPYLLFEKQVIGTETRIW